MSDKKEDKNVRHPADKRRRSKRSSGHDVGDALRSAYDRTVNEDIPPEMLDLLGKLG